MHRCLAQMDTCHPHHKTNTSCATILEILKDSPKGAAQQNQDVCPHLLLSAGKCWDAAGELPTSSSNPAFSLLAQTLVTPCLIQLTESSCWELLSRYEALVQDLEVLV